MTSRPARDAASARFVDAAGRGDVQLVEQLHTTGVDLAVDGQRALIAAAVQGHLDVVRYLHHNGVDILEDNAEVLRLAAAAGREEVVVYLHHNGAQHVVLSGESRAQLREMCEEIAQAPPIYHPSRFWDVLNESHNSLLAWSGEENFKRTINQSYFNALPTGPSDPRILNLDRLRQQSAGVELSDVTIEDPDRDPRFWTSWYPGYFIFKGDRSTLLSLYRSYVAGLYAYGLATDGHGVLARLEEPELGNPIRLRWRGRLISQDLVNSVRERNAIVDRLGVSFMTGGRSRPIVGELGAGYGRLGHVLLATTACRYVVFDLPPALHISQWYLSSLFPDKKILRFRRFQSYAEIADELAQADIAFFTPNQLALLPDHLFDAFANISSLHEMRQDQIDHFLGLMARKTRRAIYLKQQMHYENPHDGVSIERKDYALPFEWRTSADGADPLSPGFFELVAKRSYAATLWRRMITRGARG